MAARANMEDRAQQPQECLGKHLLSGIQNDFIYFSYTDCTERIRSSQLPAEYLVLVTDQSAILCQCWIFWINSQTRDGKTKQTYFPSHTSFSVECCDFLHFPHFFPLLFHVLSVSLVMGTI